MNALRDYLPIHAARNELRAFRNGNILGPLSSLAMSYQNEEMNLWQQLDPNRINFPHYPLASDELVRANYLRSRETGEVVAIIPWRNQLEVVNG
jgi:hypothetical protein